MQKSGTSFNYEMGETVPEEWSADLDQFVVADGLQYREVAFFHRVSRTLILTDLIVNLEAETLTPFTKAFARLTGTLSVCPMSP